MVDAEVLRLRKLRSAALLARTLAKILDSDCAEKQSVLARSATLCWTVARVASGHLRAHPYLSYQRGPSRLRELADGLIASVLGLNARRQKRRLSVYAQQLQTVTREVDDVRALTRSAELSDALGRIQIQMRRLANELELGALGEAGTARMPRAQAVALSTIGDSLEEFGGNSAWPYLAL